MKQRALIAVLLSVAGLALAAGWAVRPVAASSLGQGPTECPPGACPTPVASPIPTDDIGSGQLTPTPASPGCPSVITDTDHLDFEWARRCSACLVGVVRTPTPAATSIFGTPVAFPTMPPIATISFSPTITGTPVYTITPTPTPGGIPVTVTPQSQVVITALEPVSETAFIRASLQDVRYRAKPWAGDPIYNTGGAWVYGNDPYSEGWLGLNSGYRKSTHYPSTTGSGAYENNMEARAVFTNPIVVDGDKVYTITVVTKDTASWHMQGWRVEGTVLVLDWSFFPLPTITNGDTVSRSWRIQNGGQYIANITGMLWQQNMDAYPPGGYVESTYTIESSDLVCSRPVGLDSLDRSPFTTRQPDGRYDVGVSAPYGPDWTAPVLTSTKVLFVDYVVSGTLAHDWYYFDQTFLSKPNGLYAVQNVPLQDASFYLCGDSSSSVTNPVTPTPTPTPSPTPDPALDCKVPVYRDPGGIVGIGPGGKFFDEYEGPCIPIIPSFGPFQFGDSTIGWEGVTACFHLYSPQPVSILGLSLPLELIALPLLLMVLGLIAKL